VYTFRCLAGGSCVSLDWEDFRRWDFFAWRTRIHFFPFGIIDIHCTDTDIWNEGAYGNALKKIFKTAHMELYDIQRLEMTGKPDPVKGTRGMP